VEQKHKPLQLNKFDVLGESISPSMKASQYLTLLKYLPIVLGDIVSPKNRNWQFLLHLSHLLDLLFAPRFTRGVISYLKNVIADHLQMFIDLYGNSKGVRLRPKHHLLTHLPTIMLKSGPLIGMSCMRYELKNSFFQAFSAYCM